LRGQDRQMSQKPAAIFSNFLNLLPRSLSL
jgi:hypothetical protein